MTMTDKLTSYQKAVLESAKQNHIWLSALHHIRPSDRQKIDLADTIFHWLNHRDYLIYPDQDHPNQTVRELGQLTPQLILRINKS